MHAQINVRYNTFTLTLPEGATFILIGEDFFFILFTFIHESQCCITALQAKENSKNTKQGRFVAFYAAIHHIVCYKVLDFSPRVPHKGMSICEKLYISFLFQDMADLLTRFRIDETSPSLFTVHD